MRRFFILLENNSIFSECCINPGNQLVHQQVQIHMLIHLNLLFNEDEGSLLSGGSYPGSDHNRNKFLSPKHQSLILGDGTLIHGINSVILRFVNCLDCEKLLICPKDRRLLATFQILQKKLCFLQSLVLCDLRQ